MKSLGYTTANSLPRVPTKSGNGTKPDLTECVNHSANLACYEEDHLISLELGGDPRNPGNLWPEPRFGPWNAHVKDSLENRLHQMVCEADWVAAYRKYVVDIP